MKKHMKKLSLLACTLALTLAAAAPAFAMGWQSTANGWRYQNYGGDWEINGRICLEDGWYYFDENGYMLANTATPDGYLVDVNGRRILLGSSYATYPIYSSSNWMQFFQADAKADVYSQQLALKLMSQMEMNQCSYEEFKIWDDELNALWQNLKLQLPAAQFEALRVSQLAWIADKEAQMDAEGEAWGRGSGRALAVNSLGSHLTRERVLWLLKNYN